jgi:long-subunit fatty acid transport protein
MKRNLLVLIAAFLCAYSYGQNEIDALRFSQRDLTGTARGQAMGGAFGALGGDVTGIAINPAGISVYRTSEVSATLGLNSIGIETNWQNSINKGDKLNFNFDNISYIGYYPLGDDDLKNINFGFSYNRLKDMKRNYSASGRNMANSLANYMGYTTNGIAHDDLFSDNAYNKPNVPWLSILGVDGGLFNREANTNDGYLSILNDGETVHPSLDVSEKGYVDSYDFTLGTNFSNSLYLGMTFSLTDVYYRMDSRYDERFEQGDGFILDNYQQTVGSGTQINFGAIWRPVDYLRLGVAYHSPTWWAMENRLRGTIVPELYDGNGNKLEIAYTPEETFNYRMQTPYSWVFSAAGILGTKAIVSVDYELKDYTSMKFQNRNGDNFQVNNGYIRTDFKKASTLRAGLEYRFTPRFSGRLGYALIQNPYEKEFKDKEYAEIFGVFGVQTIPHYTIEGDVNYFTAGIGYRFTPSFYIDAAFVYRTQEDKLYYFPSNWTNDNELLLDSQPASFKNTSYKGLVTLGYKF